MLIDELILFDHNELTTWQIIFSHYKKWWLLILGLLFAGIGVFLFLALYLNSFFFKTVCMILLFGCFFLTLVFSKNKTLGILSMHAGRYNLGTANLWHDRKIILEKIRLKKLSAFLEGHEISKADKVRFFLEQLSSEELLPKYQSQFPQIALTLISILMAAFFTATTVVSNFFTSFDAVTGFFKPYAGFLLLFLLFYWFSDRMLIRWISESNQNKYGRLRRVLGNYLAGKEG